MIYSFKANFYVNFTVMLIAHLLNVHPQSKFGITRQCSTDKLFLNLRSKVKVTGKKVECDTQPSLDVPTHKNLIF